MAKSDPDAAKRERSRATRWVVSIFFVTMLVSGTISLISDEVMDSSGLVVAFLILFIIIFVGIIFDVIGMAVASADEKPFHSMASRKVPGAHEAIRLLRNAERVSSICNDVVGDICGVVSGSASATIATLILANAEVGWPRGVSLMMSALAAGLTVGGKAIGKTFAVKSCTEIVHMVELRPGQGASMARSAGTSAQLVSRDGDYAIIKLPSGETRKVLATCRATVGVVGNSDHNLERSGKAGRSRWLGRHPHNRGVVMNPVDHPMGGGEGRQSGGHPRSRKGLYAKGLKTRSPKKLSSKYIIERRKK